MAPIDRYLNGLREDLPRIGPKDVLSVLREDLERQGRGLRCYDADARERWLSACAEVLAQVPQALQRVPWAWSLAQSLNLVGCPAQVVIGELLRRAEAIRLPADGAGA